MPPTNIALVYPHQLFENHPAVASAECVWLVEDPLFFSQYRFHRKKLIFHRASLLAYRSQLENEGKNVRIVRAEELPTTEAIGNLLVAAGARHVTVVELCDDWLSRRLQRACEFNQISLTQLPDPHFLTPLSAINDWPSLKKSRWFFSSFYREQRLTLGILLDNNREPVGGSWSFDNENRKKLPQKIEIPTVWTPAETPWLIEARRTVRSDFPNALGSDDNFEYPITTIDAKKQLDDFLLHRLSLFGDYEDAISNRSATLFHSLLTPALNAGLLSPMAVVNAALAHQDNVPINALEGFIRQIIGWREYVRLVYHRFGRVQRTKNFLNAKNSIPKALYTGETGIAPVDHVIRNLLKSGYAHHIERLMILGNFMCLCRIDPDAVYQWFMEFFIDSYDWVMVPNVYGMSQYADGGLMTTKPYVSGSAYLKKMSDIKPGPWCATWDSLYWSFIADYRPVFSTNPRSRMLCSHLDRMGEEINEHKKRSSSFLETLK